jgi:predicted metal-dependent HD superfamily phosphohydrolase
MLSQADFAQLWQRCGGAASAGEFAAEHTRLLRAHAQPHRSYHTAQHVAECLAHLECAAPMLSAAHAAEMALAFCYHDAVYRPNRGDNEARSARWLAYRAAQFGVLAAARNRMVTCVLATQHTVKPAGQLIDWRTQLFVDIDLAIFAALAPRYQAYTQQIRWEYSAVPESLYRAKRTEVLQHFLTARPLYRSEYAACFEQAARQNITNEIAKLADLRCVLIALAAVPAKQNLT